MRNDSMRPFSSKNTRIAKTPNKKRTIAIIIGAVILCLALFVYIYVFTSPSGQQAYLFSSPQERQAIAQLKYDQIQKLTIPPSPNVPYTPSSEVVLSEKETNAIIQTYMEADPNIRQAMDKMGVQNPVVSLKDNTVELNARVKYSGVTVPVTLNFAVFQGMPNTVKLSVTSANIGRMPVGMELRQKLTAAVNSAAPGGQLQLPKGINTLRVESGKLIIVPDQRPVGGSSFNTNPQNPPYSYTP